MFGGVSRSIIPHERKTAETNDIHGAKTYTDQAIIDAELVAGDGLDIYNQEIAIKLGFGFLFINEYGELQLNEDGFIATINSSDIAFDNSYTDFYANYLQGALEEVDEHIKQTTELNDVHGSKAYIDAAVAASNIDGGNAISVYLDSQVLDGGSASSTY